MGSKFFVNFFCYFFVFQINSFVLCAISKQIPVNLREQTNYYYLINNTITEKIPFISVSDQKMNKYSQNLMIKTIKHLTLKIKFKQQKTPNKIIQNFHSDAKVTTIGISDPRINWPSE
jgi:hypothetical protein